MAGVGERQNLILQKYMDFYPDLPIFLLNKYISVTFCMFDIFDICDIFVSVKSGSRLPHKVLKKNPKFQDDKNESQGLTLALLKVGRTS